MFPSVSFGLPLVDHATESRAGIRGTNLSLVIVT